MKWNLKSVVIVVWRDRWLSTKLDPTVFDTKRVFFVQEKPVLDVNMVYAKNYVWSAEVLPIVIIPMTTETVVVNNIVASVVVPPFAHMVIGSTTVSSAAGLTFALSENCRGKSVRAVRRSKNFID